MSVWNLALREVRSISKIRIGIALGLLSFNLIANVIGYYLASRSEIELAPEAQVEASKTVFVSASSLGAICAILLTMDTFQRDRIRGVHYILLSRVSRDAYVIAKILASSSLIFGISFPTLAVLVLLPLQLNVWSSSNVLLASLLTSEYLLVICSATTLLATRLEEQAKVGIIAFLVVILFDVLEMVPYIGYLSPKTYFASGLNKLVAYTPDYIGALPYHMVLLGISVSLFAVAVREFRHLDL